MLYGREDVSGHGFIRAAKPLKMNNSALPKASAQRSGAHRTNVFPQPLQSCYHSGWARLPDERFTPAV